ncbi:S8 family serine peptidase [Staphylothermus hellenicus]|nr:S8 family serine peptidase [Staphylothermus hellenicus]
MVKQLSTILVLALLVLSITVYIAPATTTSVTEPNNNGLWQSKVDPLLLKDSFYEEGFLKKFGVNAPRFSSDMIPGEPVKIIRKGQVKIGIVASSNIDINDLARHTEGIIFGHRIGSIWYVEAWATKEDVEALAKNPNIQRIFPEISPINTIFSEKNLESRSIGKLEPTLYAATSTIGASKVWEEYNITGRGVKVAVVDTGVDFGITDLGPDAIARTNNGVPLIFDSDEIGLVLTFNTVTKDSSGFININSPVMYFDWFGLYFGYPAIGKTSYGWVTASTPNGDSVKVFPLSSFYVGNIHSKDDTFKFGIAVQTVWPSYGEALIQYTVPILFADTNDDGYYDTVYADISTTYYYVIEALSEVNYTTVTPDPSWQDFSFADEPAAYYGSEVLARDFTGDGVNDISIGTLAGYTYDWLGLFTESSEGDWDIAWENYAHILPGLDPYGNYVSIAYDWYGHGTSCASVIASRGRTVYNLGYGTYRLKGVAPEAKIASAPGYLINAITSEFFFAGFDPAGVPWNWTLTGNHKAHVISNSWGSSYIALSGFMSGADPMSMLENYITSVSGTVIVHAMGNGGPGYGTATMPGAADLVISVGASTLFDYRPLYGYLPGPGGEVVSWSDRGPTDLGTAKPDVVNIGSFAWAPSPWHFGLGNGSMAYNLFSGTSEATPMTSGSVALIINAYMSKYGEPPTPGYVKTILKSSARDLGYDPYVQGSGQVDVYNAVTAVLNESIPRVYSYSVYDNLEKLGYQLEPVEDTQIYTGPMAAGSSKEYTLYINGTGNYKLKAYTFQVTRENLINYLDLDRAIAWTPEGPIPLSNLIVGVENDELILNISYPLISHILIPVKESAYNNDYYVQFIASYPYKVFDPMGRNGEYTSPIYQGPWILVGAEAHYWFDLDGNGIPEMSETSRINYDIRYANSLHVQIGKPVEKINYITERVSEYLGGLPTNITKGLLFDLRVFINTYYYLNGYVIVPFKLEIVRAKPVKWDWISLPASSSGGEVNVKINVPENAKPGAYEGYIVVNNGSKKVLVPVSIVVKQTITPNDKYVELHGPMTGTLYENYYVEGAFDWSWRYESGDWRMFPIDINDSSIVGLVVSVKWKGNDTNIDLAVAGYGSPEFLAGPPDTEYYGSVIAAKLSLYLYGSGWCTHYDKPAARFAEVFAPITTTGTYWVIIRNTLIDASKYYPEPFKIIIVPIRASARAITIETEASSSTGSAETVFTENLILYGSYTLSYAKLHTVVVEGNASITVPSELGFGNYHVIPIRINTTTNTNVTAYLIVELTYIPQYSLGLTLNGIRDSTNVPGTIIIPIQVIHTQYSPDLVFNDVRVSTNIRGFTIIPI